VLRLGGIKILADGGIAGRTAYLNEPYVGTEDFGILAVESEGALHELIRQGHEAGFQVCVHANGDRTIEMALNGFEKALAALPRKNHRHRLEHCTVINPEILKRIRKNGLLVTPFGSYIYFHGEKMNPHYGPNASPGCLPTAPSWTMASVSPGHRTAPADPTSLSWRSRAA